MDEFILLYYGCYYINNYINYEILTYKLSKLTCLIIDILLFFYKTYVCDATIVIYI